MRIVYSDSEPEEIETVAVHSQSTIVSDIEPTHVEPGEDVGELDVHRIRLQG